MLDDLVLPPVEPVVWFGNRETAHVFVWRLIHRESLS
jgi:hypothetical protein